MRAQGTVRAAGELTPLVRLFRAHWRPLLLTYALYNVENLLNLAHPLVLGVAINGLIRSEYGGLALLVGQHLAHLFVGTARQMYDTRAFTAIYTETDVHRRVGLCPDADPAARPAPRHRRPVGSRGG